MLSFKEVHVGFVDVVTVVFVDNCVFVALVAAYCDVVNWFDVVCIDDVVAVAVVAVFCDLWAVFDIVLPFKWLLLQKNAKIR